MALRLTKIQRQLCNALQEGLPICWRPFAEIAKELVSDEKTILRQANDLQNMGVIRQIRALIDYRALGKTGTLVAAHIPQENLPEIADAVNSLEGVSHNYLREHFYNLWFTLQAQTAAQIESMLSNLSERFGIDFHSLPVRRFFKLDVRFDAEDTGMQRHSDFCIPEGRKNKPFSAALSAKQRLILSKLQNDIAVTAEPFAFLCGEGLGRRDVLRIITELVDKGVIRRIAAVVDHRKLGFIANVLFCSEVPQKRIVEVGEKLACFGMVSHCYERKTFESWPYNLFAMMHGESLDQLRHAVSEFIKAEGIDSFELLPTAAELKKQPVKHKFD